MNGTPAESGQRVTRQRFSGPAFPLTLIHDGLHQPADLVRSLEMSFKCDVIDLKDVRKVSPDHLIVVDVDLGKADNVTALRSWLQKRRKGAVLMVVTPRGSHLSDIRAHSLGANEIIHRPIDQYLLQLSKPGDLSALSVAPKEFATSQAAMLSLDALQDILSVPDTDGHLNVAKIDTACESLVREITASGLGSWIELVQKHHSLTYRHSLLVTGVATSFAQRLGFSKSDQKHVGYSALLHDIGKSRIPLAILEKPGPLDRDEFAVIQQHPTFGAEILASCDVDPRIVEVVMHHHEKLDGSGYPDGLPGRQISDLVRMLTISDIYSAMIERRNYKTSMSSVVAYQNLVDMIPKLDADLVREFARVCDIDVGDTPATSDDVPEDDGR